jgi:Icc-related predicted phosphoesterase
MSGTPWFFASDLHGIAGRYQKLFQAILTDKPTAVFLGGDLLPSDWLAGTSNQPGFNDFFEQTFIGGFRRLHKELGELYPRVFVILGNDDPRSEEARIVEASDRSWEYLHGRCTQHQGYSIYGYACVPPTPFLLKDWERYDVSRFVDLGCISPEDGWHSLPVTPNEYKYGTISSDLESLVGESDLSSAIFLFHSPPYRTNLDQASLHGKHVDYTPMDIHVGSIAIRRFIEKRQPLITLHGHIHESVRLSGSWVDRIGTTFAFSAAYDGPELALVRFDPKDPASASREII